jgi:hypothetical protein
MRKVVVIGLLAAFLAIVAASTATATPPVTRRISFEDSFTVQPGDVASCAFPIAIDLQVDLIFQVFFDDQGRPVRIVLHETWFGTDSANGNVLPEHGATNETFDLIAGTDSYIGLIQVKLGPGEGVSVFAGNVCFDADGNLIFEAGLHQVLEGDTAAYCAALA